MQVTASRRAVLGDLDRQALASWLLTRLGVVAVALAAARLLSRGDLGDSFLDRWTQWDVDHLIEIARFGYGGDPTRPADPGLPAFFPGFPLLLRALHPLVPDWRLAALFVTFAAGAVATVALARLGDTEDEPGTGIRAVLAILLSPVAVFLFAGYTEALFLAFALPAWSLARRGRWEAAVVCAAAASAVRITGVFLAIAMIVQFLTTARGRDRRRAPWLLLPFLTPAAYSLYQWRRTGDALAWQHAQERGWGRRLVPPWRALHTTWEAAIAPHSQFATAFRIELVAAAIGLLLTAWLLARRRWPEATYVGVQLAALVSSAFYLSIGRAALLWWPLWLAIGHLGVRRPWAYMCVLALSAPLMAVQVIVFTSGSWAG